MCSSLAVIVGRPLGLGIRENHGNVPTDPLLAAIASVGAGPDVGRRDTPVVGSGALPSDAAAGASASLAGHGLTARELEVLEALGERLSNAEIAERLFVSVRTAESHVSSLMRKLGATRRRELAGIWAALRPVVDSTQLSLPPVLQLLADPATFVGRQSQRDGLWDLWRQARLGQLHVAVVVGEAGMGKSRLTAELAVEVQQDGGQVRLGSCFEDLGVPYEPFVQIIGADAARLSDRALAVRANTGARALARLLPELASRCGISESSTWLVDGQSERAALQSAVLEYLAQMAVEVPQLVVIEDVHWSTVTTRDTLRQICRTGAAVPMLVVATCRDAPPELDDALTAFLSDLSRQPTVTVIALSGLSEHELGGLLADTVSVTQAADVHAATDGNPLLALEVARTAGDPGAMAGLLASRYDRLARTELDVLDVAVVIGAEFDAPLVATTADRTVEDTVKALEAAERAGLVAALPGRPGRFSFVHSLFRTARYDSLSTSTRLHLHRSVAAALRARGEDDDVLPVLAHHACAAAPLGGAEEAIDLARRAGHLARRKLALDEAAAYFRQAVTMLDLLPSPDRRLRLDLEIDLGQARLDAGHADGTALLLAAVDEARRRNDHGALANAAIALTAMGAPLAVVARGDPRIASAIMEALATIATEPSRVRARLLAGLSGELQIDEDVPSAREIARQAIAMARQLDDLPTLAQALLTYRFLIYEPALADERAVVCRELIELGHRLDEPTLTLAGMSHQFTLRREAGDFNGMGDVRAQLNQLSAAHSSPYARVTAVTIETTDRYLAGDLVGAEATIEGFMASDDASVFDRFAIYAPHLLAIRYQQGRIVELVPLIEQVVADAPHFRGYQGVLVAALARAGRHDDAAEILRGLADVDYDMPHNANWFVGTEVLADGVEILDNRDVAAVLHDRLAPFAGRIVDYIYGVSRPADQALAQLLLTLGNPDGAAAAATRAIDASRKRRTPLFLGRELVLLAEARHRAGHTVEQLRPLLDEAHQIARATGAHLIDHEIARYGLATPAR